MEWRRESTAWSFQSSHLTLGTFSLYRCMARYRVHSSSRNLRVVSDSMENTRVDIDDNPKEGLT